MIVLLLEIFLMFQLRRSMQHFHIRVMIRTPKLITRDGVIIPTSHGRLKLQATRPQGCTIKLNLTSNPTNLLPHIGLYSSNLRPHHLLCQILTFKIRYWNLSEMNQTVTWWESTSTIKESITWSKKIKEALNGLIQEIWDDSKTGHSKLGPKEDEGIINLIQAIDGHNFLINGVD